MTNEPARRSSGNPAVSAKKHSQLRQDLNRGLTEVNVERICNLFDDRKFALQPSQRTEGENLVGRRRYPDLVIQWMTWECENWRFLKEFLEQGLDTYKEADAALRQDAGRRKGQIRIAVETLRDEGATDEEIEHIEYIAERLVNNLQPNDIFKLGKWELPTDRVSKDEFARLIVAVGAHNNSAHGFEVKAKLHKLERELGSTLMEILLAAGFDRGEKRQREGENLYGNLNRKSAKRYISSFVRDFGFSLTPTSHFQ